MSNQDKKSYGTENLSGIFKALGHPLRIAVLQILSQGPSSAGEIERKLEATQSNVSQHLSVLKEQGIVSSTPSGNNRIYQVDNWRIFKLISLADGLFPES